MTTTHPPKPTVEDVQHPVWCDLSRCEPGLLTAGGSSHKSHGTTWSSRADAALTRVSVIHEDDPHPISGEDGASTRVHLEVFHTEHTAFADVQYAPAEARLIAAALIRQAEVAERDNRFGSTLLDVADVKEVQLP